MILNSLIYIVRKSEGIDLIVAVSVLFAGKVWFDLILKVLIYHPLEPTLMWLDPLLNFASELLLEIVLKDPIEDTGSADITI